MVQHSLKVSGCFNKPASEGKSVLRSCLLDLILAQNSVAWNVCHIPAGSLFRCHIQAPDILARVLADPSRRERASSS